MTNLESNSSARESILRSIRDHLAASAPFDAVHEEIKGGLSAPGLKPDTVSPNGYQRNPSLDGSEASDGRGSLVQIFKRNLEAVGGHCVVVETESEAAQAINQIVSDLQKTPLRPRRIALSDSPAVERIFREIQVGVDEITVNPGKAGIFGYDVGVSAAQYAIADTGTLVLESDAEKHRLVSLVPPVHIAVIESDKICLTIAEALAKVNKGSDLSPAVTMITGPSRTADIELTLTIGVHGPQELYVIVF
ncbi:MAG TPA: lactate utilization protein [Pyrinomonadaceae bacterium]|nr:lactate utilization protein [Pyrinomonadaceae bacterium]